MVRPLTARKKIKRYEKRQGRTALGSAKSCSTWWLKLENQVSMAWKGSEAETRVRQDQPGRMIVALALIQEAGAPIPSEPAASARLQLNSR
jgi:hypothetical protein